MNNKVNTNQYQAKDMYGEKWVVFNPQGNIALEVNLAAGNWEQQKALANKVASLLNAEAPETPVENEDVPEPKPLHKGSIVAYGEGHYQITRLTKTHCNLGHVWDKTKIRHKNVPLTEVKEDGAAFYKSWEQSEHYQSM